MNFGLQAKNKLVSKATDSGEDSRCAAALREPQGPARPSQGHSDHTGLARPRLPVNQRVAEVEPSTWSKQAQVRRAGRCSAAWFTTRAPRVSPCSATARHRPSPSERTGSMVRNCHRGLGAGGFLRCARGGTATRPALTFRTVVSPAVSGDHPPPSRPGGRGAGAGETRSVRAAPLPSRSTRASAALTSPASAASMMRICSGASGSSSTT
jgi:hypothetical protein